MKRKRAPKMKEADLYLPVKRFLESQHYEVKAEIHNCDVFAVREPDEPVIVELKLTCNLDVILQAVDRLALASNVYVAVPRHCPSLKTRRRKLVKLLKMLGLGLLVIGSGGERASVAVVVDPGEYRPRKSKHRQARLLGEFAKRVGDPNLGGTRGGIMTAYRQTALQIARFLEANGPTKAALVARAVDEPDARMYLYRDVYGWFERVSVGVYRLSPRGVQEIAQWERRTVAPPPDRSVGTLGVRPLAYQPE
jgi:hypothetical protein